MPDLNSLFSALLGAVVMAVVVPLLLLLRPWRLFAWRSRKRELEAAVRTVETASEEFSRAQGATLEIEAALEREQRKSREYFAVIEKVIAERDEWRTMYFQQSREHGIAQDMMLRERDAHLSQIIKLGAKPHLDKRIDAVVAAYREEHVDKITEMEAQSAIRKASEMEKHREAAR